MKNEVGKTIRNVVIFGIILYIINFGLNFAVDKIFTLFNLDTLYDTNIVLYGIITMGLGIILFLIAMIITKKIVSIKLKIYYEDAKKMLLILLIIFLIINVVKLILYYNNSFKLEEELNNLVNSVEEAKKSEGYKYFDEGEKQMVENLYKIYTDGKDELLELQKQKLDLYIIQCISNVVLYVVCLYAFGLYLYRKN